ncbi:MAG: hypothetical protein KKH98_04985 [Spirochaetes bacterium]|nr:hypothetical protein [Spirochaetota bacterium]
MNDLNEKFKLDFYILESEFNDGKYLDGDLQELGFKKYNREALKNEKKVDRRMYTFRSRFKLSDKLKGKEMAVYLGSTQYPYTVYLNQKKIFSAGRYKEDYTSVIYTSRKLFLVESLLFYGDTYNEVAIQIFPQYETAPLDKVVISSSDNVSSWVFWRNFFNVDYPKAAFVLALIVGIYNIFNFFTKRQRDWRYLYFAFTCFLFSFGYLNTVFFHDSYNEGIANRLSRISFTLATVFLTFLIMEFTRIFNRNIKLKLGIILAGAILSMAIFMQNTKMGIYVKTFPLATNFFITPLLLTNIGILIKSAFFDENKASLLILVSILILVGTSLHDIINVTGTPYAWLLPYGYLTLLLTIFFIFAKEQGKLQLDLGEKAALLDFKNESLNSAMLEIQRTAQVLNDSIENLSVSSRDIASAMEDINQIINSGVKHSNLLKESTWESQEGTKEGAKAVRDAVTSMEQIAQKTDNIKNITKIINDIAFQTDILSLNAAVEAARAGESGRGFAVVAGQVKELAQRSAEHADKITEMIEDIVSEIEKGNKIVVNSEEQFYSIQAKIEKMVTTIQELVKNIENQSIKMQDINKGTHNIISATESLKGQSEEINKILGTSST